MKDKLSSIQLKKPKYVLPIIALPFLLIGGGVLSQYTQPKETNNGLVELHELNTSLPGAVVSDNAKDKLSALLDNLNSAEKEGTYSENEYVETEPDFESPITDESILLNDDDENAEALKAIHSKYFGNEFETPYRKPQSRQADELALIRAQLSRMDSMLQHKNNVVAEVVETTPDFLIAKKVDEMKNNNFHTLVADKRESFISAILDEAETVVNGSRIRIRLLDDIFIGDHLFKKGDYLYGLVSGFSAQRVHVDVSSVLYGNQILKTKITIYDNDGIKGLYVPNSDFREVMRQAGSRMSNQSVSINSSNNQFEQLMAQMGRDFYGSITQAVSAKIKQNKAKLKYASIVYLINEEEKN